MNILSLMNIMKSFTNDCRVCIEETSEDETTLYWKQAQKVIHSETVKTGHLCNIKMMQAAINRAKIKFMESRNVH